MVLCVKITIQRVIDHQGNIACYCQAYLHYLSVFHFISKKSNNFIKIWLVLALS